MFGDRRLSIVGHPDQWGRCSHTNTVLDPDGGVQLAWDDAERRDDPCPPVARPAVADPVGFAFDRWCRLYRSVPRHGRVDVRRAGETPGGPRSLHECPGPWRFPVALAIDADQLLHVAEAGSGHVSVVDLWRDQRLRRISVRSAEHPSRRPIDVVDDRRTTWVLLHRPAGIVRLNGRRGPFPGPVLRPPLCHGGLDARRLTALPGGRLLVLWQRRGGHDRATFLATTDGEIELEVDGATDVAATPTGNLVVARQPEQPFRRFRREAGSWLELEPIAAPGYDAGGIGIAPDGTVAYSTSAGVGWAGGSGLRYRSAGRVVSYRLDSGAYRTRWGRLFLDACLPRGTRLDVSFLSSDEDEIDDPIAWSPPERRSGRLHRPDLTPPLPSEVALEQAARQRVSLHRRATGPERPWAQAAADDHFVTYETPVRAPPGRYLWVILELTGTPSRSPRVRELRAEHPGHRLLGQLPRSWSRDDADADFLHRFLAPAEGILHELDERAATQAVFLDPSATPEEALSWLASFLGVALDRRWPIAARRSLVSEAYRLFRRRGTQAALSRFLEIYLGYPVVILEQWRLRGLGGVLLGGRAARAPAPPREGDPALPIVGTNTRAAGTLGGFVLGGVAPAEDGFRSHAHRFSVLIPADLSDEQLDVVRHILELQRPAHTMFEICELGFGMRVGRRLHVALSSIVGGGAGWSPAIVGQVAVGGDGILGTPAVGARVGDDSVAGKLRVG
jgi:phage tail-like protein